MKPVAFMLLAALGVSACGGGGSGRSEILTRYYGGASVNFASGPISSGCMSSGRKAANRQLCGCIQAVADRHLGGGDQRMAASFFADPHKAQEIRQSDNPRHEVFWKKYKGFTAQAENTCKGY